MSLNISQSGILIASNFEEYIYEPDGSKWLHVFHHNNPAENGVFESTDTFNTGVYKDNNKWFNFNICNKITSNWEILLIQYPTVLAAAQKFRWIQTSNPLTADYTDIAAASITKNTTTSYTASDASYGGIYKKNNKTYLSANNGTSSNWFSALGAWTVYQGGVPGYNAAVITTGSLDVYIRVDSLPLYANVSVFNTVEAQEFYEY